MVPDTLKQSTFDFLLSVSWLAVVTAALVLAVIYLTRLWFRKGLRFGVCRCETRMDGKTVIVTGSNTGTGKEAARDLARRGARVILACRNARKAEKAAEEIRKSSGNGNVEVRVVDLASLSSIRDFCSHIIRTEPRLDVLVNNAGSGVAAFSLTPGYVATSRMKNQTLSVGMLVWGTAATLHRWLYGKTPLQGAQCTIHCSVADGLQSGQYFSDCKPKDPAPQARDDEAAKRLWELSEKMVGLSK